MYDDCQEMEEDPRFPEVPNDNLDPGKTDLGNLDTKANDLSDIEERLTKLKFFNQTWLKAVPKTQLFKRGILKFPVQLLIFW